MAVAERAAGRTLWRDESRAGWLFSAPGIILLLVFLTVPFALAIAMSFTNQRLISPLPLSFVGLDNYTDTLSDPEFLRALTNNALFVVVVVPVQTALALYLAVLVNKKLKGVEFFRTMYFAPVVTVMAVAATVWKILYNVDSGVINGFLRFISSGALESGWLRSTTMALPAIMIMSIWQGVGFQMIILLAALQDVPMELYDAAAVDGATTRQQFRYVTLPTIRNAIIFVVTITTILAFRLFDQVYVMTNGSGGPLSSTKTMMLRLYEVGFTRQSIAEGSAIAVIFFSHRVRHHAPTAAVHQAGGGDPVSVRETAGVSKPALTPEVLEKDITGRQTMAPPRRRFLSYLGMSVLAVLFLFPLVFMFVGSLKPDASVIADGDSWRAFIPTQFVTSNYGDAIERALFAQSFVNSILISACVVVGSLAVNSLFGYALARLRFVGRNFVLAVVVALIIIPFQAIAIPLLFMMAKAQLLNTYQVQILPFIANPFFVYLFYTFFLGILKELEEAARVDGAGAFATFWRVILPLARPAYATVAILSFLFIWGELFWPVLVTRGPDVRPLTLGISVFQTRQPVQWGDVMAFAGMTTLPVLIVFLIFQKAFVRGVATQGLKG